MFEQIRGFITLQDKTYGYTVTMIIALVILGYVLLTIIDKTIAVSNAKFGVSKKGPYSSAIMAKGLYEKVIRFIIMVIFLGLAIVTGSINTPIFNVLTTSIGLMFVLTCHTFIGSEAKSIAENIQIYTESRKDKEFLTKVNIPKIFAIVSFIVTGVTWYTDGFNIKDSQLAQALTIIVSIFTYLIAYYTNNSKDSLERKKAKVEVEAKQTELKTFNEFGQLIDTAKTVINSNAHLKGWEPAKNILDTLLKLNSMASSIFGALMRGFDDGIEEVAEIKEEPTEINQPAPLNSQAPDATEIKSIDTNQPANTYVNEVKVGNNIRF